MLPTDTASKSASTTGASPNSFRELLDRYYGKGTEGTIARIVGAREVVRLSRPGGDVITFGDPDESWDYRTSTVDRDGRRLPAGAIGWTPEGTPYYGSGIPSGARAMETLPGRMGSIVGPITNEFTEWMSGIRNSWDMYRPGGNEPTTLQRAGQISKELLTGFGEGWNALFARPIETAVGLQRGAEEAGEGSPLPDISGALRESGAVQGALRGGIKPEGAEWFVNFVMGLNPLLGAYNAFRLVTSPKPTDEKTRILGENLAASRIAYSAWKDPALRQEFIRRYMAGEDPYLLGKELQRPWAEMWGSLILDPTNAIFLAGVVGKFAHSGRLLTEAAKAPGPSDGMLVALPAFSEAKTEAQVVNASESLVRASVAQTRAAATEAAKLARGRNVWAVTTGATRDLAAEEASDIAGLLFATHKNDPERAVEILRLGAQMASESADEVMGAVGELARHQLAPYLFSESFTRVGLLLRKLLTGSDDVIDAGRFLKEVQGVSDDPIKLAELLGKRMEGAASKLYPTVAERVAAGEDVPRLVRQLERLAEGRGPIGTINRMFASVYMGLSPGYAVRNALTNYVHMFFDYGPGTFQRTPTAAAETAAKWLGGTRPVAMTRGFTPAKLVGANRSRLPFTRLAGWFESGASRMIYGNAVERSMRSMLVPGKGLPDIRILVDAGLSPEAIRYVTSEIVRNYGDTAAAEKAIRTAMSVGSADAFRSLEFLRPSEIRFLQNMPAGGTSLYDRLVNLLKDAPDAATGRRRIAELFAEFEKEAGHAAGQALTFDGAELATRPLFTAMVQAEASRLGLSAKEAQELIAIREFVGGRAMSMAQEVIGSELSKIVPAIRSMAGDATIPTALAQEGVSLQTRVASRVQQLQTAANKLRQEAGLAFRGVKAGTPEAEAVWGPWGEKMSALYREAHAATLTDIADYIDRVTAAIPNYDQANLTRALESLQEAALWDNATVEGNKFISTLGEGITDLARPYVGGVPSQAQFLQETAATRKAVQASIDAGLEAHWGEKIAVTPADEALVKYLREADGRIAEARLLAMKVADNARDFTLLNYTKRRGIDAVVGILFPYQYWYSRTYINWMRRFASHPEVISAYAKYRRGLEEAHSGAPEWWKYNVNTNELLGLDSENPLYFNLEATLNPLNGLSGVDFENSDRRQGWFANTIDDLGKFGPSTWTPISLAIATAMYMKGEKDAAAAWAGRLIPQTASMKAGLALLHGKVSDLPLQGEFDPAVQFFSGGMDPYERRRVARALGG